MYIEAGKRRLEQVRATDLIAAREKAERFRPAGRRAGRQGLER